MGKNGLRDLHEAEDIHLELPDDLVAGGRFNRAYSSIARIVDQHVDSPETVDARPDRLVDRGLLPHIQPGNEYIGQPVELLLFFGRTHSSDNIPPFLME